MKDIYSSIRPYETSDSAAVINLLRLNTPNYFSQEEEEDLIYFLENEREQYYVVSINNEIVGCGGYNITEDKSTGIICWDIIHPYYQGKSIGRSLLNYRITQIKNVKSIRKITVRTSQLVYQFYEKQGFELIEIVLDYWSRGFHLYRMELLALNARELK
jgi:N-acetylglutamate synthase-like GNAT family acetyltransferase